MLEAPNNKAPNNEASAKTYDLAERTFAFSRNVRLFVTELPRTISNQEDVRQLVRSSGSVGANYIEANESLSKKDFLMRAKICRKEAKESWYWLKLLNPGKDLAVEKERSALAGEALELTKIFGAIVTRSQ